MMAAAVAVVEVAIITIIVLVWLTIAVADGMAWAVVVVGVLAGVASRYGLGVVGGEAFHMATIRWALHVAPVGEVSMSGGRRSSWWRTR